GRLRRETVEGFPPFVSAEARAFRRAPPRSNGVSSPLVPRRRTHMAKMTGSRYFAEAMRGYGVSHLFYMNSVAGGAMKEMEGVGVKRVVCHGEKAAAYMADAYARASRKPGVCLAQDIGSTNLLAGVRDAHMSSTPVIAITG